MMVIDGKNPEKEIPQNPLDGAKKESDQASQEVVKNTSSDLTSLKGEAKGEVKKDMKGDFVSKNIDEQTSLDVVAFKNELAGLKGGIDISKHILSDISKEHIQEPVVASESISETSIQSSSALEKKLSASQSPERTTQSPVSPFVAKYTQKEFSPYLATSTRDPEVQQAHVQAASSLLSDLDVSDPNVFADPLRRIARQLLS